MANTLDELEQISIRDATERLLLLDLQNTEEFKGMNFTKEDLDEIYNNAVLGNPMASSSFTADFDYTKDYVQEELTDYKLSVEYDKERYRKGDDEISAPLKANITPQLASYLKNNDISIDDVQALCNDCLQDDQTLLIPRNDNGRALKTLISAYKQNADIMRQLSFENTNIRVATFAYHRHLGQSVTPLDLANIIVQLPELKVFNGKPYKDTKWRDDITNRVYPYLQITPDLWLDRNALPDAHKYTEQELEQIVRSPEPLFPEGLKIRDIAELAPSTPETPSLMNHAQDLSETADVLNHTQDAKSVEHSSHEQEK